MILYMKTNRAETEPLIGCVALWDDTQRRITWFNRAGYSWHDYYNYLDSPSIWEFLDFFDYEVCSQKEALEYLDFPCSPS